MLLLVEFDLILKKKNSKRNLVWPSGSSSSKMVLTLLIEIVAIYMRSTAVDVRGFGFELVPGE